MVKTEWLCPYCDGKFNSRASRLYHQRNNCEHDPQSLKYTGPKPEPAPVPEQPAKVVEYPEPETVSIDCELSDVVTAPVKLINDLIKPENQEREIRPDPAPRKPGRPPKPKPEPGPDEEEEEEEPEEEQKEEPEPIPWIILIPIMVVLLICAGALLFNDKITAYYKRHMLPPPPPPAPAKKPEGA